MVGGGGCAFCQREGKIVVGMGGGGGAFCQRAGKTDGGGGGLDIHV